MLPTCLMSLSQPTRQPEPTTRPAALGPPGNTNAREGTTMNIQVVIEILIAIAKILAAGNWC